ncbi:DNA-binding barrel domain superfamily [Sesbania bispinosa]|nr:DNA-binding barrel domain superfamily [Sesbania bispinosa]
MQKIPNNFTRKYGGDMSNPIFLKPPDGTGWRIYWTKYDGDIWFQKGWKEFATYYSLDYGHMVLFEYKDTCHFEVHIFDKSTLEIQYPFHAKDEQDKISDNSVEILEELPPSSCNKRKTKLKSPVSCPQPHKKLRTSTSGDVERSSKLQNMPEHVQIKGLGGENLASLGKNYIPLYHKDMGVTTECLKVEQLTSEITKAVMGVTNFRSKNPSFMVVIKPAYLRHYMNVPSEFIAKYLKKKRSDILLQVLNRRTWLVSYTFGKITTGWKKFASGLIFRVGEEIHSPPPQESIQGDGVNWRDLGRIPHIESKTIIISGGGKATQRTSRLITSPNSFTNGALEEANKFTSQNPFFTVIIKPDFHEDYRPRVPNAFVRNYFNNKQQMVMLQYGNKLWDVKLICYPHAGSSKFSRGWTLFARESKLLGGDVCVFELINREYHMLHVHIFRGHY